MANSENYRLEVPLAKSGSCGSPPRYVCCHRGVDVGHSDSCTQAKRVEVIEGVLDRAGFLYERECDVNKQDGDPEHTVSDPLVTSGRMSSAAGPNLNNGPKSVEEDSPKTFEEHREAGFLRPSDSPEQREGSWLRVVIGTQELLAIRIEDDAPFGPVSERVSYVGLNLSSCPKGPVRGFTDPAFAARVLKGAGLEAAGEAVERTGEAVMCETQRGGPVNHPEHYNQHPAGIECIDVIEHMTSNIASAMKYLWRAGLKPGQAHDQDLAKAIWYIERERVRVSSPEDGE